MLEEDGRHSVDHGSVQLYLILTNLPEEILRTDPRESWKPVKDLLYKIVTRWEPEVRREALTRCDIHLAPAFALCRFYDSRLRQIAYDGIQNGWIWLGCRGWQIKRCPENRHLLAFLCQRRADSAMEQTEGPVDPKTGALRHLPNCIMARSNSITCRIPKISPPLADQGVYGVSSPTDWGLLGANPVEVYFPSICTQDMLGTPGRGCKKCPHCLDPVQRCSPMRKIDSSTSINSQSTDSCTYVAPWSGNTSPSWKTRKKSSSIASSNSSTAFSMRVQPAAYMDSAQTDKPPAQHSRVLRVQNIAINQGLESLRRLLQQDLELHVERFKEIAALRPTILVTFRNSSDAAIALQNLDGETFYGQTISATRQAPSQSRRGAPNSNRWNKPRIQNPRPRGPVKGSAGVESKPASKKSLASSSPVIIDGSLD